MPPNGQLREIPQKVQKLAAHRSLASGDVGRTGPALTLNCRQGLRAGPRWASASTPSNEARPEIGRLKISHIIRLKRRKLRAPHRMPRMRPTDRKTNHRYRESYSRLFDIRRVVLRPFGPEPARSCRRSPVLVKQYVRSRNRCHNSSPAYSTRMSCAISEVKHG